MVQKILAVDDQIHILKLMERIISEKTNYQVIVTNNPLEAREMMREQTFDLIITDLKMPAFDGLEILRFIQQNNRFELVILITALATLESATEAISLGVFDYITKPFKKDQIIFAIERAMKIQRSRRMWLKFEELLKTKPYKDAERGFKEEYVKNLAREVSNNPEIIAEISKIPLNEINAFLGQNRDK